VRVHFIEDKSEMVKFIVETGTKKGVIFHRSTKKGVILHSLFLTTISKGIWLNKSSQLKAQGINIFSFISVL
jgi:hypothetical protein